MIVSCVPTVFLVDNDEQLRESFALSLRALEFDVEVFSNGEEFLENYRLEQPGCVLMDVHIPRVDGLEVLRRLNELDYSSPVVMMSAVIDVPLAVHAMRSGAVDFLTKPVRASQLAKSMRAAVEHDNRCRAEWRDRKTIDERIGNLTEKESDVLDLLLVGNLNKQIAAQLDVSVRTVELRRASILKKMRVDSVGELMKLTYGVNRRGIRLTSHR